MTTQPKQNRVIDIFDYYTEEEVSEFLKIAVKTLRNRVAEGKNHPPYKKLGRNRVFPKREFVKWLDNQELIQSVN